MWVPFFRCCFFSKRILYFFCFQTYLANIKKLICFLYDKQYALKTKHRFKMSAIKNISLYIPHIFANYGKHDVTRVFENLKIGKVQTIDFVSKMGNDGKAFNAAYIHFEYWFDNISAANFQERVLTNSPAKLMYDEPWFWLVLENKGRKIVSGERKKCLDIGDLHQVIVTPEKTGGSSPRTPVKAKPGVELHHPSHYSVNLENDFESADEMAECEVAMEEDDQCLITIDGRYVQELEHEVVELRMQLANFQNAYYAETMKCQCLAQALQVINKNK